MAATRTTWLPFVAVWLSFSVSCERGGWGNLEERVAPTCRDMVRSYRALMVSPGTVTEQKAFAFLRTPSEDAIVADCARSVAPSLLPCTEHAVGSDSAIQCADRYVPDALKGFFLLRCLQAQGMKLRDDMRPMEMQQAMLDDQKRPGHPEWAVIANCFGFVGQQ